MCAVFTKKSGKVVYYDGIEMPDGYQIRYFTAQVMIEEGQALASIQGGRITRFMMTDNDEELICLYENGKWVKELDISDAIAGLAQSVLIKKYNSNDYKSQRRAYSRYLKAIEHVPSREKQTI